MNGDGFGIGWYHKNIAMVPSLDRSNDGSVDRSNGTHSNGTHKSISPVSSLLELTPAIFKDIFPAWNNMNLQEICMSTRSDCIMAHVRAASKGTGVSHQNCHPFKAGRLLFCHNGRIPNFTSVRRKFMERLSDDAYVSVRGTTDSEVIFGLCLTILERDGGESPFKQKTPYPAKRLVAALKRTITTIERILADAGMTDYCTFNFALTDGDTMVVTRFCDQSPNVPPPSLYFAFGETYQLYRELIAEQPSHLFATQKTLSSSDLHSVHSDTASVSSDGFDEKEVSLEDHESRPGTVLVDVDPSTASFIVASNPLTKTHTWHKMPQNSIMWCTRGSHPELRLLRRRAVTNSIVM